MRLFVDVETTGNNVDEDRVLEVAALAYDDDLPVGGDAGCFHSFVYTDRPVSPGALETHGITNERVADAPKFAEIAQELADFLAGHEFVAHNASFDLAVLDREFELCNLPKASTLVSQVTDTFALAQKKYVGRKNNLDALARRGNISLAERSQYHSALVDVKILAQVYQFLHSGQNTLDLRENIAESILDKLEQPPEIIRLSKDPAAAKRHQEFLAELKVKK